MEPVIHLDEQELTSLQQDQLIVWRDDAVFRIEGPGTVDCLQGLLTNDVKTGGDHALLWGAVLTPKGMIISDLWVLRDGATAAWVIVPVSARTVISDLFRKTLPPRLARFVDRTDDVRIAWCLNGVPELGGATVAKPTGPAPFASLLLQELATGAPTPEPPAGWRNAPASFADASTLLLGWPTLGREIDEKTLVQEVRFDELAGVRYDKGCYTGQETVARLHFRGHPNRKLAGIIWNDGTRPTTPEISNGEKTVGRITTLGAVAQRVMALAIIRRELGIGSEVTAGSATGVIVDLPFDQSLPSIG